MNHNFGEINFFVSRKDFLDNLLIILFKVAQKEQLSFKKKFVLSPNCDYNYTGHLDKRDYQSQHHRRC